MVRPLSLSSAPGPPDLATCPHPATVSARAGPPTIRQPSPWSGSAENVWCLEKLRGCPLLGVGGSDPDFTAPTRMHGHRSSNGLWWRCHFAPALVTRTGKIRAPTSGDILSLPRLTIKTFHDANLNLGKRCFWQKAINAKQNSDGQDTNECSRQVRPEGFSGDPKINSGWEQARFGLWTTYSHLTRDIIYTYTFIHIY